MKEAIMNFLREEEGLTTVEYAVAGSLIALAVVTAFNDLGRRLLVTVIDGHRADRLTAKSVSSREAGCSLAPRFSLRLFTNIDSQTDPTMLSEAVNPITISLLGVFLAIAVTVDVRTRRVPNELCAYLAIFGVVAQSVFLGTEGTLNAFVGLFVGLACLLPFYALGGMGAGDVKLMAATGALLGPFGIVVATFATWIGGGVLGLGSLAYRWIVTRRISLGTAPEVEVGEEVEGRLRDYRFPYTPAIATGVFASILILQKGF